MEHYVVINSRGKAEVNEAVQAFADLYGHELFASDIEIHQSSANDVEFIILFKNEIDLEHLLYAVNYFTYPENGASFSRVSGYTGLAPNRKMLFVPTEDKEHDNCYTISETGEVHKYSFDGSRKEVQYEAQFLESEFNAEKHKKIFTVVSVKPEPKKGFLARLFGG